MSEADPVETGLWATGRRGGPDRKECAGQTPQFHGYLQAIASRRLYLGPSDPVQYTPGRKRDSGSFRACQASFNLSSLV